MTMRVDGRLSRVGFCKRAQEVESGLCPRSSLLFFASQQENIFSLTNILCHLKRPK
jgi:hypothetical protein